MHWYTRVAEQIAKSRRNVAGVNCTKDHGCHIVIESKPSKVNTDKTYTYSPLVFVRSAHSSGVTPYWASFEK